MHRGVDLGNSLADFSDSMLVEETVAEELQPREPRERGGQASRPAHRRELGKHARVVAGVLCDDGDVEPPSSKDVLLNRCSEAQRYRMVVLHRGLGSRLPAAHSLRRRSGPPPSVAHRMPLCKALGMPPHTRPMSGSAPWQHEDAVLLRSYHGGEKGKYKITCDKNGDGTAYLWAATNLCRMQLM